MNFGHAYPSLALQRGVALLVGSRQLGHASIAIPPDVCGHAAISFPRPPGRPGTPSRLFSVCRDATQTQLPPSKCRNPAFLQPLVSR